jgi:hypothetical protein
LRNGVELWVSGCVVSAVTVAAEAVLTPSKDKNVNVIKAIALFQLLTFFTLVYLCVSYVISKSLIAG